MINIMSLKEVLYTIVISCLITLILGPIFIPMLRKLKFGQTVREEGPRTHLSKNGTPTMGGIIMIIAILFTILTRAGRIQRDTLFALISIVGFGFIGFVDDYIKVVLKRSLGLRAYQKIIGQLILATILAVYQLKFSALGTSVVIPFFNTNIDLGIFYIPFIIFVTIATVNSVNLTDGLDGLASGVTMIVSLFFAIIANYWGNTSIAIVSAALVGACLGFLKYNANPARVFMGDTGSMALGGGVAAAAILMNLPLIIPIVGGIYFAESLSVIIQVTSFKLTGKRVFKMSPLHHHFELEGWHETKVVLVFWIVSVILALIGFIAVI
ncbi:Phospho-N-acetylmuramoyl-pentapeptide-transferase [Alkalithermobacter thermoalcaliphilus JW-YL-7 = DSM 7308]|uniref:Phospho-N-acetylmuramoyl-pentapeptide-transferase n=1 Tax=Alkalithermobacter thermoalcaliphilus JW-YL-7 = DSM 7308 TaxID=1121328 RepID=A0A150FPK7_CLOPD|nr:Phospho-N-acetylmuramoyl-pentapeptide-transferase [[Clostridium] paradoxum JW-YL-7 = DSM 7308]SHK98596.1 Phospho-N-acetylmuramoyl-pentapeptide-transferase [[Clostridium] paradoxum JW-YL-7 = DSM 7308]